MATSIHPSIPVLSPSFLYHPYISSFQSKDFSFTCLLPFLDAHYIIILNSLRNIFAAGYLLLFLYAVLLKLSYVCMPTFIATIAKLAIVAIKAGQL